MRATWSRDELILALDLYRRSGASLPTTGAPEIVSLARVLSRLNSVSGRPHVERTTGSVYMKLNNLRALDPIYTDRGLSGLANGGKGDALVWNELADDARLPEIASAILSALETDGRDVATTVPTDKSDPIEGRVLYVRHARRERDGNAPRKKKEAVLEATGRLACEGCGFDFAQFYGHTGIGFAEVHHLVPLHTRERPGPTRQKDLAIVCANCHRMIHRARPWLTMQGLRDLIANVRPNG